MSSYTQIFIEYKDTRDNDWHLLRSYTPLENREYDRGKTLEELDGVVSDLGGELFYMSDYIYLSGVIRDLLNDQTKNFYGRGFPKDISSDLREILQKEQDKIDQKNLEDPEYNHDWRYSKSWCNLGELRAAVETSYGRTTKMCLGNFILDKLDMIFEKLDKIYSVLVPPPDPKGTEGTEDLQDELNDLLEEVIYSRGFCDHIEGLVKFITGYTGGDIRLVYYTE